MKRQQTGTKPLRPVDDLASMERGGLFLAGFFALMLHLAFIAVLSLNIKPGLANTEPAIYRVTILPFSPQGNGMSVNPREPLGERPTSSSNEKPKSKENKNVNTTNVSQKKKQKQMAKVETEGLSKKKKASLKALQESLDEIRKDAAIERIKDKVEKEEAEETAAARRASGKGSSGSPSGGSRWGSPAGSGDYNSTLEAYRSMTMDYIRSKGWQLIKDFEGKTDLEVIIIITLDQNGKILKAQIDKKSGNAVYDQSAMRALKKADPLPPIPKELHDDTIELHFHPY